MQNEQKLRNFEKESHDETKAHTTTLVRNFQSLMYHKNAFSVVHEMLKSETDVYVLALTGTWVDIRN